MNILDYVDWRGDLPMAASPFNEVDNLILSVLAYLNLDGVAPGDGDFSRTLGDLLTGYQDAGRDQSQLWPDLLPLLRKCAASVRFGGVTAGYYRNLFDHDRQIQFSALTFRLPDETLYLAFRGTDNTLVGWREDCNFSYQTGTPGQRESAAYVSEVAATTHCPLRVGGHSKGGNFAVYGASFCEQAAKDRILQVYSNDGPGFNKTVAESAQYGSVLSRLTKIIPESSLVGILLSSRARSRVIQSDAKGVQQHNPFSWQVWGTAFLPADQRSPSSLFMDEALGRWVDTLDDEQRKTLVTTVFDALEASGCMTLKELNANKLVSYNAIARAVMQLGGDVSGEMLLSAKKLAAAGMDVLREEAKRSLERRSEP